MSKKIGDPNKDINEDIKNHLDNALKKADYVFNNSGTPNFEISVRLKKSLDLLSDYSAKASAAFTNIVTALAIKAVKPEIDIRFHQVQIQGDTDRPAGFNFRSYSEKVIYPWLAHHNFEGAKSGWQTRTLERPKPYFLDYDENIGEVKEPFLATYDEMEVHKQVAEEALSYLFYLQIKLRETKKIQLATPSSDDILLIVKLLSSHFFYDYKASKGASRLPVLALYSIYKVLIEEVSRFEKMRLNDLEEHSAADSQTGAVGDIEIVCENGRIFEAIEIKHEIEIDEKILQDVKSKIMDKTLDRYYVLTTHRNCDPSEAIKKELEQIQLRFNCQVIVNGVVPSLRYYLRMLSKPSKIFPIYTQLLKDEKAIGHEHREAWNSIVTRS